MLSLLACLIVLLAVPIHAGKARCMYSWSFEGEEMAGKLTITTSLVPIKNGAGHKILGVCMHNVCLMPTLPMSLHVHITISSHGLCTMNSWPCVINIQV